MCHVASHWCLLQAELQRWSALGDALQPLPEEAAGWGQPLPPQWEPTRLPLHGPQTLASPGAPALVKQDCAAAAYEASPDVPTGGVAGPGTHEEGALLQASLFSGTGLLHFMVYHDASLCHKYSSGGHGVVRLLAVAQPSCYAVRGIHVTVKQRVFVARLATVKGRGPMRTSMSKQRLQVPSDAPGAVAPLPLSHRATLIRLNGKLSSPPAPSQSSLQMVHPAHATAGPAPALLLPPGAGPAPPSMHGAAPLSQSLSAWPPTYLTSEADHTGHGLHSEAQHSRVLSRVHSDPPPRACADTSMASAQRAQHAYRAVRAPVVHGHQNTGSPGSQSGNGTFAPDIPYLRPEFEALPCPAPWLGMPPDSPRVSVQQRPPETVYEHFSQATARGHVLDVPSGTQNSPPRPPSPFNSGAGMPHVPSWDGTMKFLEDLMNDEDDYELITEDLVAQGFPDPDLLEPRAEEPGSGDGTRDG